MFTKSLAKIKKKTSPIPSAIASTHLCLKLGAGGMCSCLRHSGL